MTIIIDDVVQSIIRSDLYWDSKVTISTAVEITINDYENSLDNAACTLRSLPKGTNEDSLQAIKEIWELLDSSANEIIEGVTNHVKLSKLKEIL